MRRSPTTSSRPAGERKRKGTAGTQRTQRSPEFRRCGVGGEIALVGSKMALVGGEIALVGSKMVLVGGGKMALVVEWRW